VLIVENVEADALLIQRELERTRFEVECERVETRAALTTALEQQTWDLIITDRTMLQLSAMDVLGIVRERGVPERACLAFNCRTGKSLTFWSCHRTRRS
jgi:CheY-like chemotaxis protein